MKTNAFALASVVMFTLIGCVPTLNPIYTEDDLVFDESLLGTWTDARQQQTWQFEAATDKRYLLTYTDPHGRTGRFTAHLAKVKGVTFLDLFPIATNDQTASFYKFHLVPIHTVYLVKYTPDGINVAGMNYEWLENELMKTPGEISHNTFGDRRLITATTDELQDFLVKHQQQFTAEFKLQKQGKEIEAPLVK